MLFVDLNLSEPILRAVAAEGYQTATPIQAQTIPHTLDGRDVLGCAQTGTGKTAAFALPILHRLAASPKTKAPRCLVLAPTRELAGQIADSFATYGRFMKLRMAVIFGGVNQNPQVNALQRGVDILIATPGRLMDLMNQGHVDLRRIEVFVLDEADRMLDMGFLPDIKRITSHLPDQRQTMLFSATMPNEIRRFADALLNDPAEVHVAPKKMTADRIEQKLYHVERRQKPALLAHLLSNLSIERAIVFTRTKHGADRVARDLRRIGASVEAIHGDKSQNARRRALDGFRSNKIAVLVATDIASRGIDVDGISHVFNYDLARDPESHVHRIGRTARAGASGMAVSFCDPEEKPLLRAIQRLTRTDLPVADDMPTLDKKVRQNVAHPLQRAADAHATEENTPTRRPRRRKPHRKGNSRSKANANTNTSGDANSDKPSKNGKRRNGYPLAGKPKGKRSRQRRRRRAN